MNVTRKVDVDRYALRMFIALRANIWSNRGIYLSRAGGPTGVIAEERGEKC